MKFSRRNHPDLVKSSGRDEIWSAESSWFGEKLRQGCNLVGGSILICWKVLAGMHCEQICPPVSQRAACMMMDAHDHD